ncbi:DNA-binding protein [Calidifontibacter sp. DB0510]|uniref:DNA-binding protein n=1 Tax=Metallococcus carri TaxID=1656884 RepID=A0A967EFL1_9MICO|nr:DNA-binding protein [Metallococcus carri]NHN56731.1 DNA-binding protein [Metallococcus carri]NOP37892.1 DNA-binding protein [Calidifontibacter sp. DB2511S]
MSEDSSAHKQSQERLYGAPLSAVVEQIGTRLGLTQGAIAQVLGLSAPMMSHLVSGRRVKIGNPIAHSRLAQLRALSDDVAAGRIPAGGVEAAIARIAANSDTWSTGARVVAPLPGGGSPVGGRRVQELFRQVADAADYLDAARLIERDFPAIAELLRVYGASRTSRADEHWRDTLG